MSKNSSSPSLERKYEQWRQLLAQIGYLSQGSVQDRTQRQRSGAGYQWTRKVAGKTVTIALTQEQFHAMKEATNNYRKIRQLLRRMEALSRQIIFRNHPHPNRIKRLSPNVLGIK